MFWLLVVSLTSNHQWRPKRDDISDVRRCQLLDGQNGIVLLVRENEPVYIAVIVSLIYLHIHLSWSTSQQTLYIQTYLMYFLTTITNTARQISRVHCYNTNNITVTQYTTRTNYLHTRRPDHTPYITQATWYADSVCQDSLWNQDTRVAINTVSVVW